MPATSRLLRPLTALRRALIDWYQPVDFGTRADLNVPVTPALLRERVGWTELVSAGIVASGEDPLALANLRLSVLFPQRLLHRRTHGKSTLVDLDQAVLLVRAAVLARTEANGERSSNTTRETAG